MAKELRCADVGMDCDFVAKAETHEELMQKVATHAREVHGITEITPELKEKSNGSFATADLPHEHVQLAPRLEPADPLRARSGRRQPGIGRA